MNEAYRRVREFYNKVEESLNRKNLHEAQDIIYNKMPIDLYDVSIDLWSNLKNIEQFNDEMKELLYLIERVDKQLNPKLYDNEVIEEDNQ